MGLLRMLDTNRLYCLAIHVLQNPLKKLMLRWQLFSQSAVLKLSAVNSYTIDTRTPEPLFLAAQNYCTFCKRHTACTCTQRQRAADCAHRILAV